MNDANLHIDRLMDESRDFFAKGEIAWENDESEIWASLSEKINRAPAAKTVNLYPAIFKWSAAAVIVFLAGLSAIFFFYSKQIESLPGQNLVATLPDGSTVELNAGSTLKYYPLKWKLERKLKFEGEAYFMVQKGKKFVVVSENGTTQVVGTSFNIYARDDNYRVTCYSGKVKVLSGNDKSVYLEPNEHVEIENGEFVMSQKYNTSKSPEWKMGRFDFSGRPLKEVFDEMERQFAVRIQIPPRLQNRNFSSNFAKPENVEDALDYVCKSMQLKYVKQSENVFLVVEKNR